MVKNIGRFNAVTLLVTLFLSSFVFVYFFFIFIFLSSCYQTQWLAICAYRTTPFICISVRLYIKCVSIEVKYEEIYTVKSSFFEKKKEKKMSIDMHKNVTQLEDDY